MTNFTKDSVLTVFDPQDSSDAVHGLKPTQAIRELAERSKMSDGRMYENYYPDLDDEVEAATWLNKYMRDVAKSDRNNPSVEPSFDYLMDEVRIWAENLEAEPENANYARLRDEALAMAAKYKGE